MFIVYILIFVFVLGIVVLVHEFGHFLFAKRAGILCHEFSIGMGPALYKTKKGETTYALRAIPLGGYVSMAGEDPETDKIKKGQVIYLQIIKNIVQKIYLYKPNDIDIVYAKVIDFDLYGKDGKQLYIHYESKNKEAHFVNVASDAYYHFTEKLSQQIAPYDRCFESKSWINRFLTVVAGAGFNFILATLVFIIINFVNGIEVKAPVIGGIVSNSPAEIQGIQKGDKIISMKYGTNETVSINDWNDLANYMNRYKLGEPITFTVLRNGKEEQFIVTPEIYIATLGIGSGDNVEGTEINYIQVNSNAAKIGLQKGDVITAISGTTNDDRNTKEIDETRTLHFDNLANWADISNALRNFYLSEKVSITILRDGNEHVFDVQTIKAIEPDNVTQTVIGIEHATEFNFFGSIGKGVTDTTGVIGSVFETFGLLFGDKNVGVGDLSGPAGIYDMTKTFAMAGIMSLLFWVAFISANIGFVNLLPLPALDGGRLLFLVFEAIVRKPVNRKVEGYIHTVGFILFMLLFLYVTFNDIIRIRG